MSARSCRTALALAAALLLAGCGARPDFGPDDGAAARAGYPAILPLGPLLAQAGGGVITPDFTAAIEARGAALRARAAALRRPVIDAATRARMAAALARHRPGRR